MTSSRTTDRTWLVALAASLWGLSALWRGPVAQDYPALAIVFWEHLVLVVLVSPWIVPAARRVLAASTRTKVSVLVIGAGSSALATTLFTAAFRLGDPITPQVLQKLQPLFAIVLAAVVLGERLRPSYAFFAVPAVVGAWLLAFADPLGVSVSSAQAAALAVGSRRAVGGRHGARARGECRAAVLRPHGPALRRRARHAAHHQCGHVDAARGRPRRGAQHPPARALSRAARARPLLQGTRPHPGVARDPRRAGVPAHGGPRRASWPSTRRSPARSGWGSPSCSRSVVGLALHEQRSRRPSVAVPDAAEEALAHTR